MLQCVRGMCTEMATAGLGYDITGARAWLYDLDPATIAGTTRGRDMAVLLCRAHADRITVPVGWEFTDRRSPVPDPVVTVPASSEFAASLFEPRSRPEPVESPESAEPAESVEDAEPVELPRAVEREPAPPSLLERAFRAAPARSQ